MVSYIRGRTQRTLPDEEIVALYAGGLDSDTIAARANCNATTVLDLVRRAGETVRRPGGRPRPDSHRLSDAEICERYRKGQNGPDIADAAGCATSSIYNILKRNGIPRRDAANAARANAAASRARRLGPRDRG